MSEFTIMRMTLTPEGATQASSNHRVASELYAEYLANFRPAPAGVSTEDYFFYDNVQHICAQGAYPADTDTNPLLESRLAREARFTRAQKKALQHGYDSLTPDFELPRRLWPDFRGLWVWHAYSQITSTKPTYGYFGYNRVVLDYFCPGAVDVVDNLIASGAFGSVPQVGSLEPDQLDSLVAGALMQKFFAEVHECEHFELTPCDLCGWKFYPQGMGSFAGLAPPRYCTACSGMFDGGGTMKLIHQVKFDKVEVGEKFVLGLRYFFDVFGFVPGATLNRKQLSLIHI